MNGTHKVKQHQIYIDEWGTENIEREYQVIEIVGTNN
jgi:hypothetical protein